MGLEDPELPGGDLLNAFNKELIRKWTWRIPSSREEFFLLLLIRNCTGNAPGGSGALGSKFLIVLNKEL